MSEVAPEIHPVALVSVTSYVPETNPVNTPVALVIVTGPFTEYVEPALTPETVIVPVGIAHVGCNVTLAIGEGGVGKITSLLNVDDDTVVHVALDAVTV